MKILLIIIIVAVLIVLLIASRKPKVQRFLRRTSINAPIGRVYSHIDSLRAYNEWNPWAAMDPDQIVEFEGEDGEIGSKMHWKGKKTGEGVMTLTQANGEDEVCYDLQFVKPMKGAGTARLNLNTQEDVTEVSWDISVDQAFMARVFAVFMNFEKMMVPQYDKGLAKLKEISEK